MRVTGARAAAVTKAAKATKTPKAEPTAGSRRAKRYEDGFEASVEKTKKKKTPTKPPVAVSRGVVEAGSRALERDRTASTSALREAAVLLGGLTAALVVNVLHQLQTEPTAAPSTSTQRLGELTGALFIEWLGSTIEPDTAVALSGVLDQVADFSHRFEQAFGLTPFDATRRFVDFIASTEGDPSTRLRGTLYAS